MATAQEHFTRYNRDMYVEATGYYSLSHLAWLMETKCGHKYGEDGINMGNRSEERLLEDVALSKMIMEERLANIMFDYLTLASLGEARHAPRFGGVKFLSAMQWAQHTDRATVTPIMAEFYNPDEFLPLLITMFDDKVWGGSYGGPKWAEIARSAWMFRCKKWNAVTFIDHAVDLCHNGGLAFGKGFLLWCSSSGGLSNLLDDKASTKPIETWRGAKNISGDIVKYLKKAQALELIPDDRKGTWCPLCEELHFSECTIFWLLSSNSEQTPTRTLADDEYKPWNWPTGGNAVSVGHLIERGSDEVDKWQDAPNGQHFYHGTKPKPQPTLEQIMSKSPEDKAPFGCWINGYTACGGYCKECSFAIAGCPSNSFMPCKGNCNSCNEQYGGCKENGFVQCNGQCASCELECVTGIYKEFVWPENQKIIIIEGDKENGSGESASSTGSPTFNISAGTGTVYNAWTTVCDSSTNFPDDTEEEESEDQDDFTEDSDDSTDSEEPTPAISWPVSRSHDEPPN